MLMIHFAAPGMAARMSTISWNTLAMWQQQDMINSGNSKLLEVFVIVAAVSLFLIMLVIVGIAIGTMKARKELLGHVGEIKAKLMPLIETSHKLVTDLTPEIKAITAKVHEITVKVEEISGHVEEIAGVAKEKVHEFAPTISAANVTLREYNETARAANQKAREQVDRMNGIVTGALDGAAHMGQSISDAVTRPVREVGSMVNNAKASVENMVESARRSMQSATQKTKNSVGSVSYGTKHFFDQLVHGAKGLFASRSGGTQYRPAAYRSNPAPVNPPARTGFGAETMRGESEKFDPGI